MQFQFLLSSQIAHNLHIFRKIERHTHTPVTIHLSNYASNDYRNITNETRNETISHFGCMYNVHCTYIQSIPCIPEMHLVVEHDIEFRNFKQIQTWAKPTIDSLVLFLSLSLCRRVSLTTVGKSKPQTGTTLNKIKIKMDFLRALSMRPGPWMQVIVITTMLCTNNHNNAKIVRLLFRFLKWF